MKLLLSKAWEVLYAVLPITVIVLLLHATLTPLTDLQLIRFLIGAVLIVFGLSIFLFGANLSVSRIGNAMGATVSKPDDLAFLTGAGLALGFVITIAEPDLHILVEQLDGVTSRALMKWVIIFAGTFGTALLLSLGLIRIARNLSLYKMLALLYAAVFLLAFDATNATTGVMAIPFILAIALGNSQVKKANEDSSKGGFGLIGVVSIGPLISVMVRDLFGNSGADATIRTAADNLEKGVLAPFIGQMPITANEVMVVLLPIFLIFLLIQWISFDMSRQDEKGILFGLMLTYAGLFLFMLGANAGFMAVGKAVGYGVASLGNKGYLIVIGFALGFVNVLAEPTVHLLSYQIEELTDGFLKRKVVLAVLSVVIGLAVALVMLGIVFPEIQLWHYLLPGYLLALMLTYFAPTLFVSIAFDSGGVASGPMTATFILSFIQGAGEAMGRENLLAESLGMIALAAITPLIAVQVLGILFKRKSGENDRE